MTMTFSTSIGTLYSISFGIAASVAVEADAPINTGYLVAHYEFFGHRGRFRRIAFSVLDNELKLFAEY